MILECLNWRIAYANWYWCREFRQVITLHIERYRLLYWMRRLHANHVHYAECSHINLQLIRVKYNPNDSWRLSGWASIKAQGAASVADNFDRRSVIIRSIGVILLLLRFVDVSTIVIWWRCRNGRCQKPNWTERFLAVSTAITVGFQFQRFIVLYSLLYRLQFYIDRHVISLPAASTKG